MSNISSLRPLRPDPIERLSGSAKRFISSFRGRTEVPLSKGYTSLVLRGGAEGRTQMTTTSEAKRRPGRMLRRQVPEEVPEDDNMEGILPPEEDRPVRVLKPSSMFDSFVLWHPDIPVDEEMDEYLRSGSTLLLKDVLCSLYHSPVLFKLTNLDPDPSQRTSSNVIGVYTDHQDIIGLCLHS